jgi:Zn2+/Cd2+-exporting ATPase
MMVMIEKLRLDVPLLLPEVTDTADGCVSRLISLIESRPGVAEVHVTKEPAGTLPQLCIHYDPDAISLPRIRELAKAAGTQIAERIGHVVWEVDGIGHQRRARSIGEMLRALPGVFEAEAILPGTVRVGASRCRCKPEGSHHSGQKAVGT